MKEKRFMRWFIRWSLIIIGCFVIFNTTVRVFMPKGLRETTYGLFNIASDSKFANLKMEDLDFHMEPSGLIDVKSIDYEGDSLYFTVEKVGFRQWRCVP